MTIPKRAAIWIMVGYMAGSLPFSLWIGRAWLGRDIRAVGDGNPGATNVRRAGGRAVALVALLLDMLKGALPVSLAHTGHLGQTPWMIPIALAPILGHAFSPFMRGRGGKAVAVTGGIWTGLTTWEGPTIGGLGLALFTQFFGANGRAVLSGLSLMLAYLLATPAAWNGLIRRPRRSVILAVGVGNILIVGWKHRRDLSPRLHN